MIKKLYARWLNSRTHNTKSFIRTVITNDIIPALLDNRAREQK